MLNSFQRESRRYVIRTKIEHVKISRPRHKPTQEDSRPRRHCSCPTYPRTRHDHARVCQSRRRPLSAAYSRRRAPSATPRKAPMSLCLMRMRSIAAQGLREPRSPSISKRRPWRSRLFLPRPRRPSLEHRHPRSLEDDVLRAAPKSIVAFHSASPTSPPRPAASPAAATAPAARTWKVVRPRPLRRRAPSRAPKETAARLRPRR